MAATAARAPSASTAASPTRKKRPERTRLTPVYPSDRSPPKTASPWGSLTPAFGSTTTSATQDRRSDASSNRSDRPFSPIAGTSNLPPPATYPVSRIQPWRSIVVGEGALPSHALPSHALPSHALPSHARQGIVRGRG